MKISEYDPKHISFGDLNEGDVFFYPTEDDICMKVDNYNLAVILRNGCLIDIYDNVMIVPIPNARLVFD